MMKAHHEMMMRRNMAGFASKQSQQLYSPSSSYKPAYNGNEQSNYPSNQFAQQLEREKILSEEKL